ncbi:hypothetical protein [Mycetocola zhujimingii]|uniref:Uncharacterized protein n=1 Tax=Mycetocola zhujimingii TaxID=2079792 RepID=A0A2U1TGD9_9MICO|nr:hypothetical protein [Mycetocola zhujimingii]AWB86411.1 hypothetical protein C3E77_07145 [Mycetocola zhujimingii]PWC07959.1 hypothetical protein DF223_00945 [Mycetocola zhujimingii]
MERIHYATGSILTGSEIARALVGYAEALAKVGSSASVDIPSLHEDGTLGRANFLVGPASQLVSETEDSTFPEVTDADLVAELQAATARLGDAHPQTSDIERVPGDDILEYPEQN